MTDVKLPAGFEDWVEVPPILRGTLSRQLTVTIEECVSNSYGMVINTLGTRHFAPPKPKPVLPDVKPGAVLSYRDKQGRRVRAVYPSSRLWNVYHQPHTPLNTACHMMVMSESQILADVNADGFTVELDGL